ncbi:hypothetical protein LTR28_013666, partial [Elasticomyces elasticus]
LVLSSNPAFSRFWLAERCRDSFLSHVEKEDLPSIRLVCHDFRERASPRLFDELDITFKASTFTKPARIAALDRIGHHVNTLNFSLPHTTETFLPPLIDPVTGEERSFTYVPQVKPPATIIDKIRQPKYGDWETTDVLIKQYPPLFHAATNVAAFVRAFTSLSNLTHLKLGCPGQDAAQRYRRSTVDYALISLRIAIERAPLTSLHTISLLPIHASGLQYLSPLLGYGATPGSPRRWSQIRILTLHVESLPPHDTASAPAHLKLVHAYLRTFAPTLTHLAFRWLGDR